MKFKIESEESIGYNKKATDDPVCPSSGCPTRELEKYVSEEPAKRMGEYQGEGNWEIKNVTDKPLGEEWNSKGGAAAANATSLAHHAKLLAQVSNSSVG